MENQDDNHSPHNRTGVQKKTIWEIHYNRGHPSKEELLRAMRLSRARDPVLKYVRGHFHCPACDAKGRMPTPRSPAVLPRTFRFNETFGVDLFDIANADGSKTWYCNMVCGMAMWDGMASGSELGDVRAHAVAPHSGWHHFASVGLWVCGGWVGEWGYHTGRVSHARMHSCTHARTHACTHACTHPRTHARARSRTHMY